MMALTKITYSFIAVCYMGNFDMLQSSIRVYFFLLLSDAAQRQNLSTK